MYFLRIEIRYRKKLFSYKYTSRNSEPFQRTDISTQPLGLTLLKMLNCGFREIKRSTKAISPSYEETDEKKRRRVVIVADFKLNVKSLSISGHTKIKDR
jgi:hypothetical protein